MAKKVYSIDLDIERFKKNINEASKKIANLEKSLHVLDETTTQKSKPNADQYAQALRSIKERNEDLPSWLNTVGKTALTLFSVEQARRFTSELVRVRGEFQQMEISFKTMLGSEKEARDLMAQLTDTAARTPFGLQEVVGGAKQLLAYGVAVREVNGLLLDLGDIAAGLSIPLGDLVYLYGTTIVQGRMYTQDLRQFTGRGIPLVAELAKQFGVAESEVSNLVSTGKVGAKEFEKAMKSLADGKFSDLMLQQSASLTGQISNLEDNIQIMMNEIGKAGEDAFSSLISGAAKLVENYRTVGKIIGVLVATFGAYKAAIITLSAVQKVHALTTNGATIAQVLFEKATLASVNAQLLLKKAMLTNPYVLATTAIVGLATAFVAFANRASEAEEAQKRFNDRQQEFVDQQEELRQQVENDIAIVQSSAATELQKSLAYERLKTTMKSLTDQYSLQELIVLKNEEAQKALNEQMDANQYEQLKKNVADATKELERMNEVNSSVASAGGVPAYDYRSIAIQKENIRLAKEALHEYEKDRERAEFDAKPISVKIAARSEELKDVDRQLLNFEKQWMDKGINVNTHFTRDKEGRLYYQQARIDLSKPLEVPLLFHVDTTAYNLAIQARNRIQAELNGLQGSSKMVTTVADRTKELLAERKRLTEKQRNMQASSAIVSSDYKQQVNDLRNKLKEIDEELSLLGYTETPKKVSPTRTNTKDQRERERKDREADALRDKRRLQDQANETARVEIELQEEGFDKRIALLEHQHKVELQTLQRQQEDIKRERKSHALTPEETLTYQKQEQALERKHAKEVDAIRSEAYADLLDGLRQYGDYTQQIYATQEIYAEKIRKAKTDVEQAGLTRERDEAIAAIQTKAQGELATMSRLFHVTAQMSAEDIRLLADEGKRLMDYLAQDEYSEGAFGLTKEQYDLLRRSPEQIKALSDRTKELTEEALQCSTSIERMTHSLDKLSTTKPNTKEWQDSFDQLISASHSVTSGIDFIGDSFKSMTTLLGGGDVGEVVSEVLGDVTNIVGGISKGAELGQKLGGATGAAIGAVVGGVKAVAETVVKWIDRSKESEIEALQSKIDSLAESYENLGKSIETSYSTDKADFLRQQNEDLQQQIKLIQQQKEAEESKKKSDKSKIDAYDHKVKEQQQKIADNEQRAIDAIFGESVQTAIDRFANAYANAWGKGIARAETARDFVKSLVRQMMQEAIKGAIATSQIVETLREKIKAAMVDDIISESEEEELNRLAEDAINKLDDRFSKSSHWLQDSDTSRSGSQGKGLESITQDSASELNGRFAAIQINSEQIRAVVENNSQHLRALRESIAQQTSFLNSISRDTVHLAKLDSIDTNIASLKRRIEDMETRGIKTK